MSPGEIPQPEGAAKDYEQSLEIKRRIGDRPGCAITLGSRGRMYLYRGAGLRSQAPPEDSEDLLRRALDSFREDLELSEELGDVRGIIQMHSNTGLTLLKQGEFAEAAEHFSKSLGIASRLELPGKNDQIINKSFALLGLGAAQAEQGELPAAEARWAELESLQGRDGLGRFLKGDVRKFFGPHAGSFLERVEVGSPPGA